MLKYGINDGVFSLSARNIVHAVFDATQPHGDVYARLSGCIKTGELHVPVVPIIVPKMGDIEGLDMRVELGIPLNATVFGRYGGYDSFDLPFVHATVDRVSRDRSDIFFLFMNTQKFCCTDNRSNVIFLPSESNIDKKAKFIRTCDAMLHARRIGETFGMAIGEFSYMNKPVLTSNHSEHSEDDFHLTALGDLGIF